MRHPCYVNLCKYASFNRLFIAKVTAIRRDHAVRTVSGRFVPGLFVPELVGWLVGCFRFNGPLRQYFSLYRAVSQREGERGEKG